MYHGVQKDEQPECHAAANLVNCLQSMGLNCHYPFLVIGLDEPLHMLAQVIESYPNQSLVNALTKKLKRNTFIRSATPNAACEWADVVRARAVGAT